MSKAITYDLHPDDRIALFREYYGAEVAERYRQVTCNPQPPATWETEKRNRHKVNPNSLKPRILKYLDSDDWRNVEAVFDEFSDSKRRTINMMLTTLKKDGAIDAIQTGANKFLYRKAKK